MPSTTANLPGLFRLLADPIRLRVLALLAQQELGVGELARILGLSPSRLGNHLRILREAGLLSDRREGTWTFVSLDPAGTLPPDLWEAVRSHLEQDPDYASDTQRLEEVLEARRARSRTFFDRVAPEWNGAGSDFRTGSARERVAASLVDPGLVVADVGCGTGYLAATLLPLVSRLILVDHAPAMLDRARRVLRPRAAGSTCAALEFRAGEVDDLPLADAEVDAVVAGMVLHHAPDLTAFLREAWRVLRPGGVLVLEDLLPHRETWLRDTMADLRLGLIPEELQTRLRELGFVATAIEILEDSYVPVRPEGGRCDLPLFLVRARKPSGVGRTASRRSRTS